MSAACPHADAHVGQRVCRHLMSGEAESYSQRFNGEAFDYDLVCAACAECGPASIADLVTVCAECFEAAADRASWTRGPGAVLRSEEHTS